MEEIDIKVGKRLAEIRKSKKLKQEELKEMIGAPTVQMISGWENGHSYPSANYLIILAKKLDISLDYLLLGTNNDSNNKKIYTFKDAAECIIELENCGLFAYKKGFDINIGYSVKLESFNEKLVNFKEEYNNILIASKSLKPALFHQAIVDLLNKYDISIIENQI